MKNKRIARGKQPHAWYALRRTLPPWSVAANLAELKQCLPRYGVDELIVKVDTEEFTHGQPPLPWVKRYQKHLFRIKSAMEELGIVYSVNPWITVGHNDRGRHARRALPGLETQVGHDGAQAICCACPLSRVWRENTAKVWTLYAQTNPHIIWIEDDVRSFHHGAVSFGCFCPAHLAKFAERIGQRVEREELVAAIMKPGRPHRWRKEYLAMQADIMAETLGFLARTVHAVSPSTCMGLMSSGARRHCLEGRRWDALATALADGRPLYSRPPLGNYCENTLRGLFNSQDSVKLTSHCLPAGVIAQSEVENVPFTNYSKSTAYTFLQMAVSFAYGCHGVTMNLFDHCGTPMEREPMFGRMLADRKPFLEGLARYAQRPGTYRGVQLLFHEKASLDKRLPGRAGYGDLAADGDCTMSMLESHGIPTTYENSDVIATSGQQLRSFTDTQITDMLKRGILLDAVAAGVLFERGFGKLIGLRDIKKPECIDTLGAFAAEEFFNRKFGGAEKKFLTLRLRSTAGGRPCLSRAQLSRNAQVISHIVDPDAVRRHVCMYAFENALGGRVAVHLLDLATAYGPAFNHTFRAEQLQAVTRWLARGRPTLLARGGAFPLALRKDCDGQTLLGCFNLTLDAWPGVTFELAGLRNVKRCEMLTPAGRWRADPALAMRHTGKGLIVEYRKPLRFDTPLFVNLS